VLELIQAAGWPIWLLVATSVLGLALVIERFLSLRAGVVFPPAYLAKPSICCAKAKSASRRSLAFPTQAPRPCAGRGLDEPRENNRLPGGSR